MNLEISALNPVEAFTLIELLVVISIIGLLSSVVLASLSGARERAQYSAATQEMNQIRDLIILAQGNRGNNLMSITGDSCTECEVCREDFGQDVTSQACEDKTRQTLELIYAEAGRPTSSLENLLHDPWGNPYGIDENEGESSDDLCRIGKITTAGPDEVLKGSGSDDDKTVDLQYAEECI